MMKIEGNYNNDIKVDLSNNQFSPSNSAQTVKNTQVEAANGVTLSTTAKKILANENNDRGFDAKKVNQLKSLIAAGKYQVSPEKIVTGMLDEIKAQGKH
ncbi:MAG: flagellar biosynthesis anti-sigma factor FlgM [Liquorilactobacillus nagelii]|jgi:flagellar biosynthesis anti-sigma factor FlgM|uniref:flagellar biosynthesis anti-sigma factor FlgM n=1 Tax=Liquorilactobacillus nagelii TaxID=82688 RepID=UPI00242DE2AB|nr:flagellar biosynthesis anti-sigma factor FlgM [Liquorilactobacillus nagelii]MCI1920808.1 flagellar biosynthesis anti-sigma factor FlgM [Liquorilactobacillus nagelii]MCI1976860.1 flagellar biosynthesis anti-sigma factor FlgM [Liquorilactobacillus nagelii]